MVTTVFALDPSLAQRDHIGQIQVEPFNAPVVHALETGIQLAADMNYNRLRISLQEVPHVAVEFIRAHKDCVFVMPLQSEA